MLGVVQLCFVEQLLKLLFTHVTMLSFIRFHFSLVLFGWCQFVRAQNVSSTTCIEFYEEAKESVLGDKGNRERLLNAFYPLNASSPHLVWVYYCINRSNVSSLNFPFGCRTRLLQIPSGDSNTTVIPVVDYVYILADQPLWLTFDTNLLFSLTPLLVLILDYPGAHLYLIIDPPCNETNLADHLGLLTSLVSENFNMIMFNHAVEFFGK